MTKDFQENFYILNCHSYIKTVPNYFCMDFIKELKAYRLEKGLIDEQGQETEAGRTLESRVLFSENAKDDWAKIYSQWKENKTTTIDGVVFDYKSHLRNNYGWGFYDAWTDWTKQNPAHKITKEYYGTKKSVEDIYKFHTYQQTYDANEEVFAKNVEKIERELTTSLSSLNMPGNLSTKVSELFNNIVNLSDPYGTDALDRKTEDEVEAEFNKNMELFKRAFKQNVIPELNKELQKQMQDGSGAPYLPKFEKGTDWNETEGISPEQWTAVNTMLDNDPRMQELLRRVGVEDDGTTPISSPEYYHFPPASGFSEVKQIRDYIVDEYRRANNIELFTEDVEADDYAETIFNKLSASYDEIVFRPTGENALLQYVPTVANTDGRAALAAGTQSEYVNMKVPGSKGFKDYVGMVRDINKINFNQDGNYRISTTGNKMPTDFQDLGANVSPGERGKHDISPEMARMLLQAAYLSSKEKDKGSDMDDLINVE